MATDLQAPDPLNPQPAPIEPKANGWQALGRAWTYAPAPWRAASRRVNAALAQPLPAFSFAHRLAGLSPAWVLLVGGLALALLVFATAGDLPDNPGPVALLLPVVALAATALGLLGLRGGRLDFLTRPAAWLGVSVGQVACLLLSPLFVLLTGLLAVHDHFRSVNAPVANLAWLVGLGLAVAGGWMPRSSTAERPRWAVVALAAALLAVGLVLRGYNATNIPVTLTGDEGSSGLNALEFATGRADNLFGLGWHGFPALFFHIQSLPLLIFGRTIAALRLSSVAAGALTVAASYFVGRSLFGHRTGVATALFLAGFHYHLHFSRIALNNVWDGLAFVLVLGAVWHGWKTGQRASFLLAGLCLGLAQYFYPSTRSLLGLVPAWLLVAGFLDRQRLRQLLPELVLLALMAVVTSLPLAWMYLRRPDEFFGPMRAVSIFGPHLANNVAESGLPQWAYLARQIFLGTSAFFTNEVKYWYRPEAALLRPAAALLGAVSLVTLGLRPRDPRTWLVLGWMLTFGVLGGLSESTPAAQRYVGAAGVCALLVGHGLVQLIAYLQRAWPRLARAGLGLTVLAAGVLAADEARFYLMEYTSQSQVGGKHDFEGMGSAVAGRLGNYLYDLPGDWQLVFFGTPFMGYDSIPSLAYRVPQLNAVNIVQPWGADDNPIVSEGPKVFALVAGHDADLAAVMADYPGGLRLTGYSPYGELVVELYQVPPPPDAAERSQRLEALPVQAPMTLAEAGLIYLVLVLVWAIWKLARGPALVEEPFNDAGLAPLNGMASGSSNWSWLRVPALATLAAGVRRLTANRPEPARFKPPLVDTPATAQELQAAPTAEAMPPAPKPAPEPAPTPTPRLPAITDLNVALNLKPGARLRIQIEEVEADEGKASPLLWQEVQVPSAAEHGGEAQPANLRLTFGSPAEADPRPPTRAAAPAPRVQRAPPAWANWRGATARLRDRLAAFSASGSWALALFGGALAVYVLTRLIGLAQFPIYFFSDEAIQTLNAADFVRNGFRDFLGRLFPTYFQNASYFNLSVSVYAQVLPYMLLGQSILVTRGTAVLISAFGAVAVGLTLKHIFQQPWWWLGVLLLSITPAWFLHSRTAFETVIMVVFYAWFIYFYLRYRTDRPRMLLPALACAALAFYSYNPGQIVVVLTSLALLVVDVRYHWRHRRVGLQGLALLALLILPYVRFQIEQPGEALTHLRILDSYLVDRDLSLSQKLAQFGREYTFGLSPGYWFLPENGRDLARHVMRGYGNLLPLTLPFWLIGLVVSVRRMAQPPYRLLLIATLVAPIAGALTAVGITRVLAMVIPAVLLMAVGVEQLRRLAARWATAPVAVAVLVLLSAFNFYMLSDALKNAPTWYHDYGLGGMQYGARQVFDEIKTYLAEHPERRVHVTSTWTNGADYVLRFFMPDEPRVRMDSLEGFAQRGEPLSDEVVFVLMQDEYERALQDPKFTNIRIDRVLPYPDGTPGFYFLRLDYSPDAQAILAAEREAQLQPVTEMFEWNGELVSITHSQLGAGRVNDVLDADTFTLANAPGANPFLLDITFSTPRTAGELLVTTGSMEDFTVTLTLFPGEGGEPLVYTQRYQGLPPDPSVTLALEPQPPAFLRARLEIRNNLVDDDSVNIHVRDVQLR